MNSTTAMSHPIWKRLTAAAAVACACLALTQAHAQSVVLQSGFEPNQGFSLGPVSGQGGWSYDGEVVNDEVYAGRQALHLDAFGSWVAAWTFPDHVIARRDLTVRISLKRTGDIDVQAGVTVVGNTGFLAQIGGGYGGAFLGNSNSDVGLAGIFAPDAWHDLVMKFNFAAQTVSATVDGTLLGTLPLNPEGGPASVVTGISIYSFEASGPSDLYADNLSVIASGTPQ